MGKIKGWEKKGKDNWIQYSSHRILIRNRISIIGERSTIFLFIESPETIKTFKTKKEAIAYAIKYMRANSNG